jgi:hypothetical protein
MNERMDYPFNIGDARWSRLAERSPLAGNHDCGARARLR